MSNTKTVPTVSALAVLARTPQELMADERARIQQEIKPEKEHGFFERFAQWRVQLLIEDSGEDDVTLVMWARLFISAVQAFFLYCALIAYLKHDRANFVDAGVPFLIISVLVTASHLFPIYAIANESNRHLYWKEFFKHLRRYPVLPLLPLLRIFDICVFTKKRIRAYHDRERVSQHRRSNEQLLEKLKVSSIVPNLYRRAIEQERNELLGDHSELRKTERDLQKRRERVCAQRQQLDVRLKQAQGNDEREAILMPVREQLNTREQQIALALQTAQKTIASTAALLNECVARINKMQTPLEDAEFVQSIAEDAPHDAKAVANVQEVVDRHVTHVRDLLLKLVSIVTVPAPAQLEAPADNLEAYFEHVDAVARKVIAFEAQTANPATADSSFSS